MHSRVFISVFFLSSCQTNFQVRGATRTHSACNLNGSDSVRGHDGDADVDGDCDANHEMTTPTPTPTPTSSFRSLLTRLHSSSAASRLQQRDSERRGPRHGASMTSHPHHQNSEQRSRENRLTRISLSIVWLFIFCHVWKLVPTMYEGFQEIRWDSSGDSSKKVSAMVWPEWLSVINDVSHTLIVFNSAVNFLIYVTL